MKKTLRVCLLMMSVGVVACAQPSATDREVGGYCDDCKLMFEGMPANLSWETRLGKDNEDGEQLVITGIIYKKDGRTPAPGVILYVYQTDKSGRYSKTADQNSLHGHLRGWIKTDEAGRYEFTTIRPGSYPNSDNPQHIHPLIKEPGLSLYYIDEYLFDDDPLLTNKVRSQQEKRGGPGIIHVTKNSSGVWTGTRDIILGMNIPGY